MLMTAVAANRENDKSETSNYKTVKIKRIEILRRAEEMGRGIVASLRIRVSKII